MSTLSSAGNLEKKFRSPLEGLHKDKDYALKF